MSSAIGIPLAGTPIVTVIRARPEVRSVENVRVTPDDPIFPAATTGSPPDSQGFYPSRLVEVVPSGLVRDQRVASLQINPVQYNSATKQLKVYTSITFRVEFPGAVPLVKKRAIESTPLPSLNAAAFESLFRGTLRNYDQAKRVAEPTTDVL